MDTAIASRAPYPFPSSRLGPTNAQTISPAQLARVIGTPAAPLVLDVRREAAFEASPRLVAGALRCAPEHVAEFARARAPGNVVAYCVHGHHVSAEVAATLRAAGWQAALLEGGIEGGESGVDAPAAIAQWHATPVPTMRKRPDLGVDGTRGSAWVTREHPKIDRVACPWLIRRFIDPRAAFHYLPTQQVLARAGQLGAVAFDIPGAPISHVGERCSFDALIEAFELRDPALDALAAIVRGADTDRLDLSPECPGLLALSLGLSASHADHDLAMLDAAMPMYDALYAFCRLRVANNAPRHDWNPAAMQAASR